MRRWLATLAVPVLLAGCGAERSDYQSVWSTSSTTTTTTDSDAPALTIAQYLEQQGVEGVAMTPATLKDLSVSIPHPAGWSVVADPAQPSAYEIIRKTGPSAYPPTASLLVFTLVGKVDAREAIKYGYVDAERSDQWRRLNASMDDFRGFPSAMIEGSYNLNGERLHSYNRIVIATGSAPANQPYLVQFKVTTASADTQAQAPDVEQIIKGFTVAAR